MHEREEKIRLWFSMWLRRADLGIEGLFADDAIYIESWGPKYVGRGAISHWFWEWNTRGRVLIWDIRQFFHRADQTMVEWYFKNQMHDGRVEEFDGVSLVRWTKDNKIRFLKEFGCHLNPYDPYAHGDPPQFREGNAGWF